MGGEKLFLQEMTRPANHNHVNYIQQSVLQNGQRCGLLSALEYTDSATLSSNFVFCSSEGTIWLWWYFLWAKWFAPYQCTALFDTKDELALWNLPLPYMTHPPPHNVMYYLRASFNIGFLGSPEIAQNSPTFHALNIFQGEKEKEEGEEKEKETEKHTHKRERER